MTRTITITSGKEGVGKTNISVNLALHLATLGYRTCLFDADLGLANVNMLLGLYPEYNLEDVILYHRDLEDVIIRDHEGIDIIPGSTGVERIADLEAGQIEHLIESFSKLDGYNFLLFDTSAGISKNVISFCLASSEVIVVITPELASLTDAYALLKILCLNGFKGSVRVVVSRCKSTSIARHAYIKFKKTVIKYFPIDVVPLGIIVQDPKVEAAVRGQQAFMLLYPESNASKCIKSIAKRLREEHSRDLKPSGTLLFWTKFLKLIKGPMELTAKKKEIVGESSWQTQEQGPSEPIQKTGEKLVPQASKDVLETGKLGDEDRLSASQGLQLKDRRHIFQQIETPKNLPTLPHLVLRLIEVCNREKSSIDDISQIVNKDVSLSAKVMSMVNSAGNAPRNRMTSIEEAVSFLGRDAMKTVAISAAAHSDFDQAEGDSLFGLKRFWWHSLMCATLAKLISGKTSSPAPEEAFLSGLFHDIGKLVLWMNFPEEYADILRSHRGKPDLLLEAETRLGATHCEVGAWIISRWNLQSFVADAILYHHEPVHRVLDALPLVKIVFVANTLCSDAGEDPDAKFRIAEEVFGFARSEVDELISLAEEEVKQVAKSLGIKPDLPDASNRSVFEKDAEKQKDLVCAVRDISLLQGTLQNLLKADGKDSILKVLKQGIQALFDVHSVLFFLLDSERDVLVGKGINKENDLINDLAIPLQEGKSLLLKSLHQETPLDSFGYSTKAALTITDKQLIRFLGKDGMLCLPMITERTNVGVIVLGIDDHHISHLQDQVKLLTMFANQAALALAADHLRQGETNRFKDAINKIQEVLDTMTRESLLRGIAPEDIERLVRVEHPDPHSILGVHPYTTKEEEGILVRAFHPDAIKAEVLIEGKEPFFMEKCHPGGLFACFISHQRLPVHYMIRFFFADGSDWESCAPYRFLPTLGDMDLYLAGEGTHRRLYERLGAHLREIDGVRGVSFTVWAPNAKRVSVVGGFNQWDGRVFPMRQMGSSGIWELFVPGLGPDTLYKYEIKTPSGELRLKTDPYAFAMELRPKTASVVWDTGTYQWTDDEWMASRSKRNLRQEPMAIYEVHLGSWMRITEEENRWLTYRELAPRLVQHVKKFGFTHVELLPVAEHPFDGSWGYQVTGYYAPTSRFGSPDDFKYFVDTCHQHGIGVILDWVPAHFPKDDYSLRLFDGTALYEHLDPSQGEHAEWGTLIFNFGRKEVLNFLIANALFWLDKYHIDGLRVDAVASMLYLDYGRQDGGWIPNQYGGNENLEAIEFFRKLNEAVYGLFPGCFTIAEESTAWPGVTVPAYLGGLGFGFKWDMGWMHDTLLYFSKEPVHRKHHHNNLTFSMMYAYSENFVLPFSHDEVVYGKGSLLRKMPGDEWQKRANLRLLLGYMYTHPGKKLLFMGAELASWDEWYHEKGLDWHLQSDPKCQAFQRFMMDLGKLYLEHPALWELDPSPEGFSWIDCNDSESSVISFVRYGKETHQICVFNFTPVPRDNYRIGVPGNGSYRERINSDSAHYGGSDLGNEGYVEVEGTPSHGFSQSISLTIPPLACLILEPAEKQS